MKNAYKEAIGDSKCINQETTCRHQSRVPCSSTRWPCDSCDSFATISWRWFIKIYTISLSFSFFLKNLHFSFFFEIFFEIFFLGVRKLVNPLRIPYCLKPHLNIWIFSTLFKRFDSFSANVGIQVGLSLLHFTLNFLHYTFFFFFASFSFVPLRNFGGFFLLIWWGLHRCVPPSSRCTKRQRRGQQK